MQNIAEEILSLIRAFNHASKTIDIKNVHLMTNEKNILNKQPEIVLNSVLFKEENCNSKRPYS